MDRLQLITKLANTRQYIESTKDITMVEMAILLRCIVLAKSVLERNEKTMESDIEFLTKVINLKTERND